MMEEPRDKWILWTEQPLLTPTPRGRCSSTVSPTLPLFLSGLKPAPFLSPIPTSLGHRNWKSHVMCPDESHSQSPGHAEPVASRKRELCRGWESSQRGDGTWCRQSRRAQWESSECLLSLAAQLPRKLSVPFLPTN